jgi:aryl-alcohol dehydrogenase (NADP+)
MEYRVLGRTGVQVSRFGLGTMVLGAWGNRDHNACARLIRSAIEAGVNLIDTADVYGEGESEEIVGESLIGVRSEVVLATKFHNPMGAGPNRRGNSRRWMTEAVEASLRRLRTDWIDIYQVHRPDETTSIEEVVACMNDLVRAGKIRYWGTSTFPAEQIVEAHWAANRLSGLGPHTEQPPYSILCRGVEAAVLGVCGRYGMGVLTWSPLSGGWLTGKYGRAAPPAAGSRAATNPDHFDGDNPAKGEAVERLTAVAADAGLPLTHMALAWAVEHPAVTSALIGPRTEEQLDLLLGGSEVRLDSDTLDAIDEVVAPGTNLNPADAGWAPTALSKEARRRPPSSWSP